eukprot:TRINITY_DN108724_c0_g1_i1.p1 TRINITY_DN108724_c0_g1~~TRINITY_DN108724_c0_g1_i1.p1  ORF type:complete len:157 (+),score=39.61 TRINITY_DN108724_c0_g1_i1:96-566(+)
MTFAAELRKIVEDKKEQCKHREKLASKWRAHESELHEKLVEAFKQRCMKEAESEKCDATVSFAMLVRDVKEFPTHVVVDSQHLVDDWGEGAASWWYYAHRGTQNEYSKDSQVSYAELLESMMPKFLEEAQVLGFQKCYREAGTWKVVASWATPDKK